MEEPTFAVMIAGTVKAGMEDYVKHYFTEMMQPT